MAPLAITLGQIEQWADSPVAVEIIGADHEIKWAGAIALGSTKSQDLPEGRYLVNVHLPSGRKVAKSCEVHKGTGGEVNLLLARSISRLDESLPLAEDSNPGKAQVSADQRELLNSIWLRLWGREEGGRWMVRPWPVQEATRKTKGLVQYDINLLEMGRRDQYYLQIGGSEMRWRLVALPADDLRVVIAGKSKQLKKRQGGNSVDVSVLSKNRKAQVLLGYMMSGQFKQAHLVRQSVIEADELLRQKHANPSAAAIAGYFLLQTSDLDALRTLWINSLELYAPWFLDAAVINAWHSMSFSPASGDNADDNNGKIHNVRGRFVEVATRGLPVYTRGLRLLFDGLAMLAHDKKHSGFDIDEAYKRVYRYASVADWLAPTTTFFGQDPTSPGNYNNELPDDPNHVIFVAEPDEKALAWKRHGLRFDPSADVASNVKSLHAMSLGELAEGSTVADALKNAARTVDVFDEGANKRHERRLKEHTDTDDDQRTIARLLSVADRQTQSEKQASMNTVALPISGDAPVLPQLRGLALERIVGRTSLLSVSFLERGATAAQTVGRITLQSRTDQIRRYGTGFFVSPRLFMTHQKIISTAEDARSCTLEINYQDGFDGRLFDHNIKQLTFDPETFFLTNAELGFTLVAVSIPEERTFVKWNHLEGKVKAIFGEYLSVIQHTNGAPKQVGIRDVKFIDRYNEFVHYNNESLYIEPGAPLFNDQWEVIGVHHASIPKRDANNQVLSKNNSVWIPSMGTTQIKWDLHEGVGVSYILRFVNNCKMSGVQADVRDELIYGR